MRQSRAETRIVKGVVARSVERPVDTCLALSLAVSGGVPGPWDSIRSVASLREIFQNCEAKPQGVMSPPAPCPSAGKGTLVSSASLPPGSSLWLQSWAGTRLPQTLEKPQSGRVVAKLHVRFAREASQLFSQGVFKIMSRVHGKRRETVGGGVFLKHLSRREIPAAAVPEGLGFPLQLEPSTLSQLTLPVPRVVLRIRRCHATSSQEGGC